MPSARQPQYDAVVIGSGPNGLSAAVNLARAGMKTLVVEAAPTPGGGTRTEELTLPGFQHDVCSAVHPTAVASPFFRSLGLERFGLKWCHPEIPLAHPLDGGRAAVLHRSLEETADGLGRDGYRYRLLFEALVNEAEKLFPSIFTPLSLPRHPLIMSRFGVPAALPAEWLARAAFVTDEGRALLAGNAAHSVLPLTQPFTSAIGVLLQLSAHAVGWPVAQGGSASIHRALIAALHEFGGELVCDWPVRTLDELPEARAYLFDTSPQALADIGGEALPLGFRRSLRNYRHGPGIFKVDYALSAPVPWTHEACRRAGTVHVGGTLDEIAVSEADAFEGRHSEQPFVLVGQQSLADPTRAPAGKHTLWAYCHVPARSDVDMEERITAQIERFAPGFRDTILARHVANCAHVEARNLNCIGGDVIGGMTDFTQLLTRPVVRWNPYTTPNPKIFLCSASTPPAGGVHGMCGYNASQALLDKLKR